jgi:hypothetical protein
LSASTGPSRSRIDECCDAPVRHSRGAGAQTDDCGSVVDVVVDVDEVVVVVADVDVEVVVTLLVDELALVVVALLLVELEVDDDVDVVPPSEVDDVVLVLDDDDDDVVDVDDVLELDVEVLLVDEDVVVVVAPGGRHAPVRTSSRHSLIVPPSSDASSETVSVHVPFGSSPTKAASGSSGTSGVAAPIGAQAWSVTSRAFDA